MDPITHALFLAAGKSKRKRLTIVGGAGLVRTSDDGGLTWDARTGSPTGSNVTWYRMIFEFGRWIAVGGQGSGATAGRVMTSPDGETWTAASVPSVGVLGSVSVSTDFYGNPILMAIELNGNKAITSTDGGLTWGAYAYSLPATNWSAICPALSSGFLAARASSTSGDGTAIAGTSGSDVWVTPSGGIVAGLNDICFEPSIGVAVALAGSAYSNRILTSSGGRGSGTVWTARTASISEGQAVRFGNGLFCAVGFSGSTGQIITSPTGATWTSRTGPTTGRIWLALTFRHGKFFALACNAALDTTYVMSSPDGINWTEIASFAGLGGAICGGEI